MPNRNKCRGLMDCSASVLRKQVRLFNGWRKPEPQRELEDHKEGSSPVDRIVSFITALFLATQNRDYTPSMTGSMDMGMTRIIERCQKSTP